MCVIRHDSIKKMMSSTYKEVDDMYIFFIKKLSTSKILRIRKVTLKITFRKILTLNNCALYSWQLEELIVCLKQK